MTRLLFAYIKQPRRDSGIGGYGMEFQSILKNTYFVYYKYVQHKLDGVHYPQYPNRNHNHKSIADIN